MCHPEFSNRKFGISFFVKFGFSNFNHLVNNQLYLLILPEKLLTK